MNRVLSLAARLGFDAEFDSTAAETRRNTAERLGLSLAILGISIPNIGLESALAWWLSAMAAEVWLWCSTSPATIAGKPRSTRLQRLLASLAISGTWVVIGLLYWREGQETSRLMTVALLAGILLYSVRACYKSILHLLAGAAPPALCVLCLPWAYRAQPLHLLTLQFGTLLLVGFTANSAKSAYTHHRRLMASARELIEKRDAAEAGSRAKSEFLANMSHEIRTPLNGVMGISGALAKTRLTRRQAEMVGLIESSARNLEVLVSDVLDLTRIESGKLELSQEAFAPATELRACAELFRDTFAAKGLHFAFSAGDAASLPVIGDPARLRQIVCNLLSNAAKFTESGSVSLSVAAEHGHGRARLVCKVADTGIGFDDATKARLFERFEQADGSITRRYGGSGLGLAISSTLAEAMGGTLTAESDPGRWSCFTLVLDLAADAASRAAWPDSDAEAPSASIAGLRVLLAEDHPINRRVVELILGAAGVKLTCVENGAEAVEAAGLADYDLILMDMQMPVMDGLAAIRLIRAGGGPAAQAPIYTLTANAMPEHADASAAAGADGHITKPVTPAGLIALAQRAVIGAAGRQRLPMALSA